MPLTQAFSLTPRNPLHYTASDDRGYIYCHGVSLFAGFPGYRKRFEEQHSADEAFFNYASAADAAADYTNPTLRRRAPHVRLFYDLSAFAPNKEVALTFRFDAETNSRLLIYSNAALLDDETLVSGDNQLLIEVESTDSLSLYFIHATRDSSSYGGSWFFRGIEAYIA